MFAPALTREMNGYGVSRVDPSQLVGPDQGEQEVDLSGSGHSAQPWESGRSADVLPAPSANAYGEQPPWEVGGVLPAEPEDAPGPSAPTSPLPPESGEGRAAEPLEEGASEEEDSRSRWAMSSPGEEPPEIEIDVDLTSLDSDAEPGAESPPPASIDPHVDPMAIYMEPPPTPSGRKKKFVSVGPMKKDRQTTGEPARPYAPVGAEVPVPKPPPARPRAESESRRKGSSSTDLTLGPVVDAKLNADYLRVQSYDYFKVLNVPTDAPHDDVQRSYLALVEKYRPEKFMKEKNQEIRAKQQEIFLRASTAFGVLSDLTARRSHEQNLAARGNEVQVKNRIIFAQMEAQKGQELLRMGQYKEAAEIMRKAVEVNPKEPVYHLLLGWALYQSADSGDDQRRLLGKGYLEQGISMNPIIEDGYIFLGRIRKREGEFREAEELFRRLQILSPGSAEAQEELDEIAEMKRQRSA